MIGSLIYLVFGLIELLIGVRFVFLLLGANPASPFVAWVYAWSSPLVAPFSSVFGQHAVATPSGVVVHGVLDWTSLVALIAFAIIGAVLSHLLAWL